jgi:signal transduction histidine kinase
MKLGYTSSLLFQDNYDALEKGKTIKYFKEKTGKNYRTDSSEQATDDSTENIKTEGVKNDSESVRIILIKKIADERYVILYRTFRSFYNATVSAILFDVLAGVIIIVIGVAMVLQLSNYVLKPIADITDVAEHIADLEFDVKAPENGEDELAQLGKSINRMSGYLESNLLQLQEDIDNRKKLVRNLSHEIKSPVAVIMGYAERLKAVILKNPDKAVSYCEIITNESGRIDSLVKEMLEFSKLEQRTEDMVKEEISIKQLFEGARERIHQENMGRDIDFSVQCGEDDMVKGDFVLIERALHNLLANAVAYGDLKHLRICLNGRQKQNFYEIRVYNSGKGIPNGIMTHIWEPFVKVDEARTRGKQGSGVGLSIVREIVEAHEGYYNVENQEGGVEFLIAVKN